MGVITLDDGRSFKVDDSFGKLPLDQQQSIVGELKQQLTSGVASDMVGRGKTVTGTAPVSDELSYRGNILPLGKTKEGNIVPAIPGVITSAADAVRGFINAGTAGPPGSREVTEAAIGPSTEAATAFGGAAAPAAEKAAGQVVKRLWGPSKPNFLSTDELHEAGSAAYKSVENAGVVIKPEAFREVVSDVVSAAKDAGFDKDLQLKSKAALSRLAQEFSSRTPKTDPMAGITGTKPVVAQPISLPDFDNLMKVVNGAATAIEPDDRRIAGVIKGVMNDFLSNITEKDVIAGNAKQAAETLRGARDIWKRYSKSSEIDTLFEHAGLDAKNMNAGGFENALRNQFKRLAKNEKKLRKYSADEQTAIKDAAGGSNFQEALKKVGKFAPTAGFFGGVLNGEILAQSVANPVLLAIPVTAGIARWGANKLRRDAGERVRQMVSGGKEAANYLKNKKAGRRAAVTDIARRTQRPGLLGASSVFDQQ